MWRLPRSRRWPGSDKPSAQHWLDLPCDIPDGGGQLLRDRHADLVQRELAGREMPVAFTEAQLLSPGDQAHHLGLAFLAPLQGSAHARREAVVQEAASTSVCRLLPVFVIWPCVRLLPLGTPKAPARGIPAVHTGGLSG